MYRDCTDNQITPGLISKELKSRLFLRCQVDHLPWDEVEGKVLLGLDLAERLKLNCNIQVVVDKTRAWWILKKESDSQEEHDICIIVYRLNSRPLQFKQAETTCRTRRLCGHTSIQFRQDWEFRIEKETKRQRHHISDVTYDDLTAPVILMKLQHHVNSTGSGCGAVCLEPLLPRIDMFTLEIVLIKWLWCMELIGSAQYCMKGARKGNFSINLVPILFALEGVDS